MTVRIDEFDEISPDVLERLRRLRDRVRAKESGVDSRPEFERQVRRPKFAGRQRILIARRPGRDVATAVVRRAIDMRLSGRDVATIGNFEARHDPKATSALLTRALRWARRRGVEVVVGPMNGDGWHRFRCTVGPWEESPFFMEPYNPSYYPELWHQGGFEVLEDYLSVRIDDLEGAARANRPRWAAARTRGYRIEPTERLGTGDVLDRVFEMAREIYGDHPLYPQIRRATFKKAYRPVTSMLDGASSFLVVDRRGADAGFALVCPDSESAGGDIGSWFGTGPRTANVESFGVVPDHRGRGVAGAMAHQYFARTNQRGYEKANLCLVPGERFEQPGTGDRGRVLRRYALYHREVD